MGCCVLVFFLVLLECVCGCAEMVGEIMELGEMKVALSEDIFDEISDNNAWAFEDILIFAVRLDLNLREGDCWRNCGMGWCV